MDKYKLEYEMKSKGITAKKLCDDLDISLSAYYRKISGRSQFTLCEIQKIVEYLNLGSPMGIFFSEKVSYKTQTNGIKELG